MIKTPWCIVMSQPNRRIVWFLLVSLSSMLTEASRPVRGEDPAPSVSIDAAFAQLKTHDDGRDSTALHAIASWVAKSTGDAVERRALAERLAAILADPAATAAGKRFAGVQLRLVASDDQVPLLEKLLGDSASREMARAVLDAIPGEAAARALRGALNRLDGDALAGVIHSLGARRDAGAVDALSEMLRGRDRKLALAAAAALGHVATPGAAAALGVAAAKAAEAAPAELPAILDAELRSAERSLAGGDIMSPDSTYERIWSAHRTAPWGAAALKGLVATRKAQALPLVLDALGSPDPSLRAAALEVVLLLPGGPATAAITKRLASLDPRGQIGLIGALAERGDRTARGPVEALASSQDEALRTAAIDALGRLGEASTVERLARAATSERGAARDAARRSLALLSCPGVDAAILAAAARGDPAQRAELLHAAAERRSEGAAAVLLEAALDADERVRIAALDGLATLADPASYSGILGLAARLTSPAESSAAAKALLEAARGLPDLEARADPVIHALGTTRGIPRMCLLRVLGALGGEKALEAVRSDLAHADQDVRGAALDALAAWPDESAAGELLKLARGDAGDADHGRALTALRGYYRLASSAKGGAAAQRKLFEDALAIGRTADAKKMLLEGLASAAHPAALEAASTLLADREVCSEAANAMLRIGAAIANTHPVAVVDALRKLEESPDRSIAEKARAIASEAARSPSPEALQLVLRRDEARSRTQRRELARRAPKGYRLTSYLDCGPDMEDGKPGGAVLRIAQGEPHIWPGSDRAAAVRFATILFHSQEVVLEASGLSPAKSYRLGFSWWDYDANGRIESVLFSRGERILKPVNAAHLPGFAGRNEAPEERIVPVPREITAGGAFRVAFRNDTGPNAVVSEVWLWEASAEVAGETAGAPAVETAGERKEIKVLIVTGQDYPGHHWRETAPALAAFLRKDPRVEVSVVEDPAFLASRSLHEQDVAVLHFMNWEQPDPGPEARANLERFVDGGKGLVILHFACGAFQGWPGYASLAGRIYDPKLPPHDPRGPFRVDVASADHPVTRGLKPFDTDDELYTCLAGDRPIEILATARSRVDGKEHPMAFAFAFGRGRVFHSPLGHDVKALESPGVGELLRRGCAWAGGMPMASP